VQSRRDHLQAYQFAVERLQRAALAGHTAAGATPMRRSALGVSIGVVISVLLCGGALVFGLLSPTPSTAWRNPGAIIVDQQTGTRYLLLGGGLHATANYASALLVAGQNASMQSVSSSQLTGMPVGGEIGIPGAPDEVPSGTSLLPGIWALCSKQNGSPVLDLDPSADTGPGPDRERVFVSSTAASGSPGGSEYLVWDSVKYPLQSVSVLAALGLGDQQPNLVHPVWLAALPTGAAVAAPAVPRLGAPGPSVAGRQATVGTLFATTAGGAQEDYILLSDGLAPISRTEAALFELENFGAPLEIGTAQIAAAPVSADHALLGAMPDFLAGPVFNAADSSLCVAQATPGSTASSRVVTEQAATVAADRAVVLPAGAGMLVQPPGQSTLTPNPVVYLITDSGERYLVDSTSALDALGYAEVGPIVMPPSVFGLIPSGPNLDVNAAAQAVTWPSG
jgi:type VII secretion protein EccB